MDAKFNFDSVLKYFLDGLTHILPLPSQDEGHEHLKGLVTAKQAEYKNEKSDVSEVKSTLDLAFRLFLVDLLESWARQGHDASHSEVDKLVELALWGAHNEIVDPSLVLSLFEDLFDSQTIDKCQSLFSILESRAPSLSHDMFVQERAASRSILLRVCTTLLKRLSKTNNAEFCGRILIFLAYVFPLSDRSGINIKSECNIANVTVLEDPPATTTTTTSQDGEASNVDKMETDKTDSIEDPNQGPVDYSFYHTFWSLHSYFQNFQILFQSPEKWTTFVSSVELVLSAFAGNANLEDVVQQENQYFTKYLTSSNLMKLQLKDTTFRRHILVQLLILFQALTTPVLKQAKTLKDKQRQQILELTDKVKELLHSTQPKGPQFTKAILDILQRENNWILWKRESCKGFERSVAAQAAQPKRVITSTGNKAKKVSMGNAELSRLWNLSTDNHEMLVNKSRTPSLNDFLKPFEEKMDNIKEDKVAQWKALRLIAKTRFKYFSELSDNKTDMFALFERELKGVVIPTSNGTSHIGEELLKKHDLAISGDLDMTDATPSTPTLAASANPITPPAAPIDTTPSPAETPTPTPTTTPPVSPPTIESTETTEEVKIKDEEGGEKSEPPTKRTRRDSLPKV